MRKQSVLRNYLNIMSRHRGSICIILLTGLVASYFLSLYMPKHYKATTFLFLPTKSEHFRPTEEKALLSLPQVPTPDKLAAVSYLRILRSEDLCQRIARRIPGRSARSIQKSTRIKGSARTPHCGITVRDRNPKIAAEIANAYPAEANKFLEEMFLTPIWSNRAHLKQRIRETERDLRGAERQLQQLKTEYKIASPSEEIAKLVKGRAIFTSQLEENRIRREELNAKVSALKKQLAREAKMQLSSESKITNPVISHLKTTLATLQIRIAGALSRYSEEHPEVIRLKTEYAQTKENLEREVYKILGSQTKSINPVYARLRQMVVTDSVTQRSLEARAIGLERLIRDLDERIAEFPELDNRFADLQRQVSSYENALTGLKLKLEEAKLNEIKAQRRFEVLDKAAVPKKPYFPNPLINMLIAGALALCVSTFYVIGMAYSGRKRTGKTRHLKLSEWQQQQTYLMAAKLMSMGLLTRDQVLDILTLQRKESPWRFLQIAIKLGYVTHQNVEQAMKLKGLLRSSDGNSLRITPQKEPSQE